MKHSTTRLFLFLLIISLVLLSVYIVNVSCWSVGYIKSIDKTLYAFKVKEEIHIVVHNADSQTRKFRIEPIAFPNGWSVDDGEWDGNNYKEADIAAYSDYTFTYYVTANSFTSGKIKWKLMYYEPGWFTGEWKLAQEVEFSVDCYCNVYIKAHNIKGYKLPGCGGTITVFLWAGDASRKIAESSVFYHGQEDYALVSFYCIKASILGSDRYSVVVYNKPNSGLRYTERWGSYLQIPITQKDNNFEYYRNLPYISGFSVSSSEVVVGDTVPIKVTVKNPNNFNNLEVKVRLIIDSDKKEPFYPIDSSVVAIPKGGQYTFVFNWKPSAKGEYYIYALVMLSSGTIVDQHDWYGPIKVTCEGYIKISVTNNDDDVHKVTITIDDDKKIEPIINPGESYVSQPIKVEGDSYHKVAIKWFDNDRKQWYDDHETKYVGCSKTPVLFDFTLEKHLSRLIVKVHRPDGSNPGSGIKVKLYDKNWHFLREYTTSPSGKVVFSDLPDAIYHLGVFYGEVVWGYMTDISVGNSGDIEKDFYEYLPNCWGLAHEIPHEVKVRKPFSLNFKVKNYDRVSRNVKVYVIVDKDKVSSWDGDCWSDVKTISPNKVETFSVSFTVDECGTYYIWYRVYTFYNGKWLLTDEWQWGLSFKATLCRFTVIAKDRNAHPISNALISVYNSNGAVSLKKTTDSGGIAIFELPVGTYNVELRLPYGTNKLGPCIAALASVDLNSDMQKEIIAKDYPATLVIKAFYSDGKTPLKGIRVKLCFPVNPEDEASLIFLEKCDSDDGRLDGQVVFTDLPKKWLYYGKYKDVTYLVNIYLDDNLVGSSRFNITGTMDNPYYHEASITTCVDMVPEYVNGVFIPIDPSSSPNLHYKVLSPKPSSKIIVPVGMPLSLNVTLRGNFVRGQLKVEIWKDVVNSGDVHFKTLITPEIQIQGVTTINLYALNKSNHFIVDDVTGEHQLRQYYYKLYWKSHNSDDWIPLYIPTEPDQRECIKSFLLKVTGISVNKKLLHPGDVLRIDVKLQVFGDSIDYNYSVVISLLGPTDSSKNFFIMKELLPPRDIPEQIYVPAGASRTLTLYYRIPEKVTDMPPATYNIVVETFYRAPEIGFLEDKGVVEEFHACQMRVQFTYFKPFVFEVDHNISFIQVLEAEEGHRIIYVHIAAPDLEYAERYSDLMARWKALRLLFSSISLGASLTNVGEADVKAICDFLLSALNTLSEVNEYFTKYNESYCFTILETLKGRGKYYEAPLTQLLEKIEEEREETVAGAIMTLCEMAINPHEGLVKGAFYVFTSTLPQILSYLAEIPKELDVDAPFYAMINAYVNLTIKTPFANVPVFIDGEAYYTNSDGTLILPVIRGQKVIVQVPKYINLSKVMRAEFLRWSNDITSNCLELKPIANMKLDAIYTLQYYLNISSPFGEVNGSGWHYDHAYAYASLDRSIYPDNWETCDTFYVFDKWVDKDTGQFLGDKASKSYPILMDRPKTVIAEWAPCHKLSVRTAPFIPVKVYSKIKGEQDVYSDEGCLERFFKESTPVFVWVDEQYATQESKYIFSCWSGDITSIDRVVELVMDKPKSLVACFDAYYKLTVKVVPKGLPLPEITPLSNDGFYGVGTSVTLTAKGLEGYRFLKWVIDKKKSVNFTSITVTMDRPHEVIAIYKALGVNFSVLPEVSEVTVPIGKRAVHNFTIINTGDAVDTYLLSSDSGSLNVSSITLSPGEYGKFSLIFVPSNQGTFVSHITVQSAQKLGLLKEVSAVTRATHKENRPPIACFNYMPKEPKYGDKIIFNASCAKDSDGEIVDYKWHIQVDNKDFYFDGESFVFDTSSLSIPERGIPPLKLVVNLTVIDDKGATNSSCKTIWIWTPYIPSPKDVQITCTKYGSYVSIVVDVCVDGFFFNSSEDDWGSLVKQGNVFMTNAKLWIRGPFCKCHFIKRHEYALGLLSEGAYFFVYKAWSKEVKNYRFEMAAKQTTNAWNVSIDIQGFDSTKLIGNSSVFFGLNENASDGFDRDYDVVAPSPPISGMYAYFYENDFSAECQKLIADIKALGNVKVWTLYVAYFREGPVKGKIILSWDSSKVRQLPENYLVFLVFSGRFIDMRAENNLVIPVEYGNGCSSKMFTAEIIVSRMAQYPVVLKKGWNLISLPVLPANNDIKTLFKDKVLVAYGWDLSRKCYVQVKELEVGKGYWVFALDDVNITICGSILASLELPLKKGWNLIGSLYGGSFLQIPNGGICPAIYYWDVNKKEYVTCTELPAGCGAWVLTFSDVNFSLISMFSAKIKIVVDAVTYNATHLCVYVRNVGEAATTICTLQLCQADGAVYGVVTNLMIKLLSCDIAVIPIKWADLSIDNMPSGTFYVKVITKEGVSATSGCFDVS